MQVTTKVQKDRTVQTEMFSVHGGTDSVLLAMISGCKLFHNRAASTAKAQSPTVAHCDWGTSSWCVSEDCRRRLDGNSDKCRRSAGAMPFSER